MPGCAVVVEPMAVPVRGPRRGGMCSAVLDYLGSPLLLERRFCSYKHVLV